MPSHYIEGREVWNCDRLLQFLRHPNIVVDEHDYTPQMNGDDFVALAGWKFNVSSMIYGTATPEQVIGGWTMFQNDMGHYIMDRLIQPFFYRAVVDANSVSFQELCNHEPDLVELLRLSYWYQKCSRVAYDNTFSFKRKEIRQKLTGNLISNIEGYKTSVIEQPIDNVEEFLEKVKAGVISARKGKPMDEDFSKKYVKQLLTAVWSITSELMFAGASSDYGYKVGFDIAGNGHDYDFIVNNDIPSQVKTITPEEQEDIEIYQKINNRIQQLKAGRKISKEEVEEETLKLLRDNYDDIKKAIAQGGRIICVNGRLTYAGFLLNQWASSNNHNMSTINKALVNSTSLLKGTDTNFLPLIFGATAIDYNYRFSTWSFKIPIMASLDGSELDIIKRI
jgi:hypothetical protein